MGRPEPPQVFRVRIPREGEIIGVVLGRMGGGRFTILCSDKKERLGRIPGKIRRRIWVKEGDIVIIKPWEIEFDKKGDILWRYTRIQSEWLRKRGHLKDLPV